MSPSFSPSSSISLLVLNVLILPVFAVTTIALYRLFYHPLSCVPGPRLAAVSTIWYVYHARNGRMLQLGKTLHVRYGPVVRVSPNEVWISSKDGFRGIYNVSNGCEKSDFYLVTALRRPQLTSTLRIQCPDTLDFLAERDMKRYRLQRRLIGPLYQASSLKKYENAVNGVLGKVISQIKTLDGIEVDLKQWMHIIAVECLGAVVLSWSPGYLQQKSDGGTSSHSYLGWRRKSVFGLFPYIVIAETYSRSFGRAFANLWGLTYKTPKNFKTFFNPLRQKSSKRITANLKPNPRQDNRQDLLAELIQLHKSKPEFSETYLRRLAITNLGAGHETTTSALTAAVAMIGSHVHVQKRVAEEVRRTTDPTDFDNAVPLSYTQACIKEAQRLYPAFGMSLPRNVPVGGLRMDGYYLPHGTTVGCCPAALHRNTGIFGQDAEVYNPDRWLDEAYDAKAMERFNLTWGGGARTCPGRHLAELIVYKVIPALVKEFDLEVTMPPEEEMPFYFISMLTGVKVRFLPKR